MTRRVKECLRKHKHLSRGAADAHIRALLKIEATDAERMHPYACWYCGGWHVGREKLRRAA